MIRHAALKTLSGFFAAGCLLAATSSNLFAHAGHKHEKPPISLPDVTAKVNGTDITKDVILRELEKTIQSYKDRGMKLTPDQVKTAAKKAIDDEISRTLLVQKGEELGISVTPDALNKKLGAIKASFKSDAVFEHTLADSGLTMEQYKKELQADLVMDQVIKKEVEPKVQISEKELRAYYDANPNKFRTQDKVRASVILIKIPPKSPAAKEHEARKKLESIRKRIESGTDFAAMARKFSQDSLASKGGDLGFFGKKQMLPAFSKRAFAMKVGELSEIFQTKHGLHILKVTDRKPGETRSFESEKEKIRQNLLDKKLVQATRNYVENLKKKAKLKTYF